jgi:ribose-phosphate pyrophosphokinase
MNGRPIRIIDGTANSSLVHKLVSTDTDLGSIAEATVTSFSDGETNIEINENMRGCDVFVVQPTSPPANEHLMQLYLILDALKRSNCWHITAVIPYFGYGRQDKKLKPRVPISARAVADLIQLGGVDRVLTLDLHSNQIQGFFSCPIDNLFASSIFLDHMRTYVGHKHVMVSPDEGGVERMVYYAERLNVETAIIYKKRLIANKVDKMVLIGDVQDKNVIMIDDMIDTAGTLCKAAELLKENGAKSVKMYATHGIFSGMAYQNIFSSVIDKIYVTDTIEQPNNITNKIEVLSCSGLLSRAISNIHKETSVSRLFV